MDAFRHRNHVFGIVAWTIYVLVISAAPSATTISKTGLIDGLRPIHYTLFMHPFLTPPHFQFKGRVDLKLYVERANITTIHLHAQNLTFQDLVEVTISQFLSAPFEVQPKLANGLLTIDLKEPLRVNCAYTLGINFTGALNRDVFGFYHDFYMNDRQEKVWFASTQFAPMYARSAFPCFDDPVFKAKFQVNLIRSPLMNTTVANMALVTSERYKSSDGTEWIMDSFEETPPLPTYLVAFTVSNFIQNQTDGSHSIIGRPMITEKLEYASSLVKPVLDYMKWYTGRAFTNKLDLVVLPNLHFNAMENWGHITIREVSVMYDEEYTSAFQQQHITYLLAHELAHNWFGNLITMDWFDHVWLNEGFATLFQYKAANNIQPQWDLLSQFVILNQQEVMLEDLGVKAMSSQINQNATLSDIYSNIVYSKAASVIRMFEHVLGEKTFRNGIISYIHQHAQSTVDPNDLFASLQTADDLADGGVHVRKTMATWCDLPGYPIVHITSTNITGVIVVRQTRFGDQKRQLEAANWYIPLSYTTHEERNFRFTKPRFWMQPNVVIVGHLENMTSSGWVVFNIQQTGYFRVNYDRELWQELIAALKSRNFDGLPEITRSQLIDDAMNLARIGILDYDVTFALLNYLVNEVDYLPWTSAFRGFNFLHDRLLDKPPFLHLFQKKLLRMMRSLIGRAKFEDDNGDSHTSILLKSSTFQWMCKLNSSICVDISSRLFRNWKAGGTRISPNIRETVFCTALKTGGCAEWDFLWPKLWRESFPAERDMIWRTLGCTQCAARLQQMLHIMFEKDDGLRKDNFKAWSAVAVSNPDIVRRFFMQNYNKLMFLYGANIQTFLNELISRILNPMDLVTFKKFLISVQYRYPNTLSDSITAAEQAEKDLEWNEGYQKKMFEWLSGGEMDSPKTSSSAPNMPETVSLLLTCFFATYYLF